ncbi:MAG TPA: BamA/TamA family outer membrane protein, partial [Acidobacteriota bacterium]
SIEIETVKLVKTSATIGVLFLRYNDRGGSLYEFNRLNFDTRQFIPLGSSARVLALRFAASFTDVANDRLVPFYLMETLGGSHSLRGFPEFRFRDRHLMHLSAEYRFEAATWLEFAAFYDAGKVFSRRSEFDFNDLQKAYGGGVRFKSSNGVLLRVDVGKSTEGVQVYLKLGSSF